MHLRFPKKRDFWTFEELSCLSRTLGFQRDLFFRNVPKDKFHNCQGGLSPQEINELFESKALSHDLHRTFNMHDAAYNAKVIKRSMELLSNRFLTFQQIKNARMAFQFYEHMDNAGLVINENIILRTLKMCGRAVSPLRLMQHIKHMDRLVPDRIMFYEFLDLLLICEKISTEKTDPLRRFEVKKSSKKDQSLYELIDFRDMLLTEDEKVAERLNQAYKKSLEKLPMKKSKESSEVHDEKPWLVPPIVDHETREKMSMLNKQQRAILCRELESSNVKVLADGTFPSCNCDKPDLIPHEEDKSKRTFGEGLGSKLGDRPAVDHILETPLNTARRQQYPEYHKEKIVTEEDFASTRIAIEDIQWNIATQGERMRRKREPSKKHQRRYRDKHHASNDSEKTQVQEENITKQRIKGSKTLQASRPARTRIKELSLVLRKDENKTVSNQADGATSQPASGGNGMTDNKISLDERLRQIDILMNRVCQR